MWLKFVNSLPAALLKWRVFIVTIGVSGVMHLAVFGGWLAVGEVPRLGPTILDVSVTGMRVETPIVSDSTSASTGRVTESSIKPVLVNTAGAERHIKAALPETMADPPVLPPSVLAKIASDQREVSVTAPLELNKVIETETSTEKAVKAESLSQTDVTEALSATASAIVSNSTASSSIALSAASTYQVLPSFMTPPAPPKYPRLARKRGIEGRVILQLIIDREGRVAQLRVEHSSGSKLLDRAAQKAVQRWRFVPAKPHGITEVSSVRVPIDFVLEKH